MPSKPPVTRSIAFSLAIQFFETLLAQAVAVVFLQIGFGGVVKFHFHAPAVDGMHAFEFFSATGTGLFHSQKRETSMGGLAKQKMNINYLNNIALGMTPASNELSSRPSLV
jgi:hypothetical protein